MSLMAFQKLRPVPNHVLTIGQDLFSIKTKKVERRLIQMRENLTKILSSNYLTSGAMTLSGGGASGLTVCSDSAFARSPEPRRRVPKQSHLFSTFQRAYSLPFAVTVMAPVVP
jgi:hypothetical protein